MRLILLLFLTFLFVSPAFASLDVEKIPTDLKPWVPWVMHNQEEQLCSHAYNSEKRHCLWPSALTLEIQNKGGSFSQKWMLEKESWLLLPGNDKHWPSKVVANEMNVSVVEHEGRPAVHLPAGSYSVSGHFKWDKQPASLAIPLATALINLSINGEKIPFLDIENGKLWLKRRAESDEVKKDNLAMRVYRHVTDSVPMIINTRMELQVSGQPREIVLGWVVPDDQTPLQIKSSLPAKLENNGQLRVQVRPGNWGINLVTRFNGPTSSLSIGKIDGPWPQEEILVFNAQNHLRMVKLEGVPAIDPTQTTLPRDWQNLPAYRLTPKDTVTLVEKKRGDPDPEPNQLSISKQIWLDDDGKGVTIQDKITGTMTSGWRLEMDPSIELGRATVNGQDQLITQVEGSKQNGIELRKGQVTLSAVSRSKKVCSLKAVGWNHDFKKAETTLHLPPGWRLLHASGVDRVSSWISQWNLLDLFIVLIVFLSSIKLLGPVKGVIGFVTLILLYQDYMAPKFVWLSLLAAIALLRVLPEDNKFAKFVAMFRYAALASLIVISIPYIVYLLQTGIYPQLEMGKYKTIIPGSASYAPSVPEPHDTVLKEADEEFRERVAQMERAPGKMLSKVAGSLSSREGQYTEQKAFQYQYETNAQIQTGPGLPQWQWRQVHIRWNGPVEAGQDIKLYLLSPMVNLLLAFLKTGLLLVFASFMFPLQKLQSLKKGIASTVAGFALFMFAGSMPSKANADNFPPQEMLTELQARIMEPDECLPDCASIDKMTVKTNKSLTFDFSVHALSKVSLPLPSSKVWRANHVSIDDKPALLFRDASGGLWVQVSKGQHLVKMAGVFPERHTVSITFPLIPHYVEFESDEWEIEGLKENGVPEQQLQFRKINKSEKQTVELEPGTLPPLVRVERQLRLGLKWEINTVVHRESPVGSPVILEIPLLEGESVTSANVEIKGNKIQLNMGVNDRQVSWHSVFEQKSKFSLHAAETTSWFETWTLDISPVWHVAISGIPVVHHQGQKGQWQPEWRPWPGETVTFQVSRPAGVEGPTKTIDTSKLEIQPGKRATDVKLSYRIRSNRGDQQTVTLPDKAKLQTVTINGQAQPIRQQGNKVTLPLVPGAQDVALVWRESVGISAIYKSSEINLGMESANSQIETKLGQDRWVWITGGPRIGPAILFYGELLVVLLVAVILGRLHLTPLKTYQWVLLGLGISQTGLAVSLVVVAWFLALGARKRLHGKMDGGLFNLVQLGIGFLTLVSLVTLVAAVQHGLLGHPDMAIAGNGSSSYLLKWYQDRVVEVLPQIWIFSVPILVYRLIMLAWALWLAFSVLRWLRWGWDCFSEGALWQKAAFPRRKPKSPAQGEVEVQLDKETGHDQ
ncbi:MAG: hypothetical protein KQH63_21030 [Desulfobulbaceae bacterium]|nr:hypothetical protein [Desulfobulbaceae bacterium]